VARLIFNNLFGTGSANLSATADTITFSAALTYAGGVNLPSIAMTDHVALCLDARLSTFEIVELFGYTSGGTTGLIRRGREGTSAVAHTGPFPVGNDPTVKDFPAGRRALQAARFR